MESKIDTDPCEGLRHLRQQGNFVVHLTRYETSFASEAYTTNTFPLTGGDCVIFATRQRFSGSLQLDDTYERLVVAATTLFGTKADGTRERPVLGPSANAVLLMNLKGRRARS